MPQRQLAQIGEPVAQLNLGRGQQLASRARVALRPLGNEVELQSDGHEPLLSTVVKIALQAPTLLRDQAHELLLLFDLIPGLP
jgi:hypothetical protein